MFGKDKFLLVFNTNFALFFSIVLTLFVKGVSGALTVETFVIGFMQGFVVSFALEFIVDLPGLGAAFLKLLHIKKGPQSAAGRAVFIIPIVAVMVVLMSGILMFWEIGFAMGLGFFGVFLSNLLPTFVVAYVTAFIFFPISMGITHALCTKEPVPQGNPFAA